MNFLNVLGVVLMLLKGMLAAAGKAGATQVVDAVTAAIAKLESVRDMPVTKAQVESLRITPQW